MNYKQQLAAVGSVIGTGFTAYTFWKSAIYYGKSNFIYLPEISTDIYTKGSFSLFWHMKESYTLLTVNL